MKTVNIAEAKSRLSELIALVERGEEVVIARRGSPVARICTVVVDRKPLDIPSLRRAIEQQQTVTSGTDAATLVRRMRDARY